jgi:hypothetical protein
VMADTSDDIMYTATIDKLREGLLAAQGEVEKLRRENKGLGLSYAKELQRRTEAEEVVREVAGTQCQIVPHTHGYCLTHSERMPCIGEIARAYFKEKEK